MGANISRRLNILVVTPSYPTEDDPVNGIFVREQALAVAEHVDVNVLHLARGYPRGVLRVPGEPVPTWRSGFSRRAAPLGLVAAARAGFRALPKPDLVHAHFFLGAAPAVLMGHAPVVTTEHWVVFLPDAQMPLSVPRRLAARYGLNRSSVVIAVSETLASALRAAGVRAPIVVLPNAVDEGLFHPPSGVPAPGRLLTVGVLTEQKGIDVLLEALALIPRGTLQLEIVGDGPARADLEAGVRALGLSAEVEFTGFLPKAQIAERMRSASIFVLASRFESNGVVVLEALSSGLPVVAAGIGPLAELIDTSNGILATPGDPRALAEAIRRSVEMYDTYDRPAIADAAHKRYGRESVGRALVDIYRGALK